MEANGSPRVVLVHDWLTGMRGGEKCLEVLCRRWPHAQLLTLLHQPGSVSAAIEALRPQASFLQYLPGVHRYYRYLLPLMPAAARWRVPACELVVSISHCVAKAVCPPRDIPHVCYCLTPMRYAWHLRDAYFGKRRSTIGRLLASIFDPQSSILDWIRDWDRRTAERVTHFVAISKTVQQRISDCYGRASEVIYPPVDTDFYSPAPVWRQDYYLVVSAFALYKRLDLAIEACNRLQRHLVIIGTGQDERRLRFLAGPTIQFLGWQPDRVIRRHLRQCRALLFPGEEDFGIVPVEAQACGTPVIAFGHGGATETVIPPGNSARPTGLWFQEQTVDSLAAALEQFERCSDDFDPEVIRCQALRFSRHQFEEEMFAYFDGILNRNGPRTSSVGHCLPITGSRPAP